MSNTQPPPKTPSGFDRETAEINYRLHLYENEAPSDRRTDSYNRVMFYVGLVAFALIGAAVLF